MIQDASAPATPPHAAPPAHVLVLVAEDNPVNQALAKAFLKKSGFTHRVVANGQEAVDAVRAGGVDLVLMDCQMPTMDGYQATARIRELAAGGELANPPRIVALTANAMPGDREKCLDAGMDDFVSKPIDEEHLVSTIHRVLADSAPPSATASATINPQPSAVPPPLPAIDSAVLLERCMNMTELARHILGIFEQSCRVDLDHLADAMTKGDLGQVADYAHKIKGAAAQVAADRLRTLAHDLEQAGRGGEADQAQILFDQMRQESNRCLADIPNVIEGLGS